MVDAVKYQQQNPTARIGNTMPYEILQPELLLPEQTRGAKHWSGERRLMLAVLEDALAILQRNLAVVGSESASRSIREIELWIWSSEMFWFSFLNICDCCELNPQYIRAGIADVLARRRRVNRWAWKRTELGTSLTRSSNTPRRSVRLRRSLRRGNA